MMIQTFLRVIHCGQIRERAHEITPFEVKSGSHIPMLLGRINWYCWRFPQTYGIFPLVVIGVPIIQNCIEEEQAPDVMP